MQDAVGLGQVSDVGDAEELARDPREPQRGLVCGQHDVEAAELERERGREDGAEEDPERDPSRQPRGRRRQQRPDPGFTEELRIAGLGVDDRREALDLVTAAPQARDLLQHQALAASGIEEAEVDGGDPHSASSPVSSAVVGSSQRWASAQKPKSQASISSVPP